jgi:hypothetical protein
MVTTPPPVVEFNPVHFCEALYSGAKMATKKRIGQEPTPHNMQMTDLLSSFRDLRYTDTTEHFGLIVGEWNEGMAIISTFLAATRPKAAHVIHPEIGVALADLLAGWVRFEDLPKETRNQIQKTKQLFLKTEDKFLDRIRHFFNEMKLRTSALGTTEKENVLGLIGLYLPKVTDACHKRDVDTVFSLLSQVEIDLTRLAGQRKDRARPMATLLVKTRHDLAELEAFGNKGHKSKKTSSKK